MNDARGKPNKKDLKAEATRSRICNSVVELLDREGYSETSINRVQSLAGVSRGALTHHFPTKQDLVSETAMRLLEAALAPFDPRRNDPARAPHRPVDDYLRYSWLNVVDTREGRAFLEILVACRTDSSLHAVLEGKLHEWEARNSDAVSALYQGARPEPDDAALLSGICRSFLRGMLIHRQFVPDPAYIQRMIDRFAEIMADQMRLRGTPPPPEQE